MKKSIPAVIFGLIGSISCLIISGFASLLGNIVGALGAISTNGGNVENVGITIVILSIICFIGSIIGIVGACFCFKNSKVGGILLSVATILCGSLLVFLLINNLISSENSKIFIIVYLIPLVFLIVSVITAFLGKGKKGKPIILNSDNENVKS